MDLDPFSEKTVHFRHTSGEQLKARSQSLVPSNQQQVARDQWPVTSCKQPEASDQWPAPRSEEIYYEFK